ncbi:MAG: hypothetical protein JXR69_02675 [Candidatus Delongbacteria bacterium]|nr:hypothetical protein [Candidatus Delongbacteria bacterium]
MCKENLSKILSTLKPLKEELEHAVNKVTLLFSEFDSIDFDAEEEKEEIEEAIENIENVMDSITRDEGKQTMLKEIDAYKKKIEGLDASEQIVKEIQDLFEEIKSKAEELDF